MNRKAVNVDEQISQSNVENQGYQRMISNAFLLENHNQCDNVEYQSNEDHWNCESIYKDSTILICFFIFLIKIHGFILFSLTRSKGIYVDRKQIAV